MKKANLDGKPSILIHHTRDFEGNTTRPAVGSLPLPRDRETE